MKASIIDDPVLGKLAWDAKALWWIGQSRMIDGKPFSLSVATISYMTQLCLLSRTQLGTGP
jgi:hypothetical protein